MVAHGIIQWQTLKFSCTYWNFYEKSKPKKLEDEDCLFGHTGDIDNGCWTNNHAVAAAKAGMRDTEKTGPRKVSADPGTMQTGLIWLMLDQEYLKPD